MQRIVRFSWLAICAMSVSASWLSDVEKTVHRWLDHLEHQFHGPYVGHHHRCPDGGKVLILCSSHVKHQSDGTPTGGWLEMIAQPYFEFTHSGLDVVIASVKGGNVPMDPISLDRTYMTRATKKFTNDSKLMALLQNTLAISKYDVQDFDGIFVVGGHGAAYDMPKSIQVENMLQSFIATNKPIAAVAHGTAALVNLKAPDGSVFVEQRKFAAFTNEEEEELNLIEVMQYESALRATCVDKLISLGGNWLGMEPWVPYSIADRGLITGQNPASSERTAESLVDVICGPDPGPTSPEEGEL